MTSVISKILAQQTEIRLKNVFENLKDGEFEIISPFDPKYNCIAHAAGDDEKWWWTIDAEMAGNDVFWFDNIPSQAKLENFILAFGKLDYRLCGNIEVGKGFEKVAVYVSTKADSYNPARTPTHMARQLLSGRWTSKLG